MGWISWFRRSPATDDEVENLRRTTWEIIEAVRTAGEAADVAKRLRLVRKDWQLAARGISHTMRATRALHTDAMRRQAPAVRGFGWAGRIVRASQADKRHSMRVALANELAPLERDRIKIQSMILVLDEAIIAAEQRAMSFRR